MDRGPHRLARQTRTATPWQDRRPVLSGNFYRGDYIGLVFRHDQPQGLHLVDAGVGAVEHARNSVKAHFALDGLLQGHLQYISIHF